VKVVVLAKEVPDLEAMVKVSEGGDALEVEKRRSLNFFDEIAVEAALQLKTARGASVLAVSAGPSGSGIDALRRALAMGADAALLVDDTALEGAEPLTVARALAAVLRKEGYDLVLAGKQATDDEAGLVGPMVAEILGIPCVVGVTALEFDGRTACAWCGRSRAVGRRSACLCPFCSRLRRAWWSPACRRSWAS
jgi:electron transfer flavoprotein beta subunit